MTNDLDARVVQAAREAVATTGGVFDKWPDVTESLLEGRFDNEPMVRFAILGARAALAEIERDGGWREGDTAPQDGTVFLTLWGSDPMFAGFIDGEFRILIPPARGWGFGIHGNYEPFTPEWWMPIAAPPTSHPHTASQTEQA